MPIKTTKQVNLVRKRSIKVIKINNNLMSFVNFK